MTTAGGDSRALRAALVVTGGLLLIETVAMALAATGSDGVSLVVTAGFPGGPGAAGEASRFRLSTVVAHAAVLVPLALAALARLIGATTPVLRRLQPAAAEGRLGLGWWSAALTWPITVFLVAQLNGVTDVGALVLTYAIASAAVLLCVVQEFATIRRLPREFGFWAAAAVGIVPWGVIALHQLGAGFVGAVPSAPVRIVTLAVLAASIAAFLAVWRARRRRSVGPAAAAVVVGALPPLLLAAITVLAIR